MKEIKVKVKCDEWKDPLEIKIEENSLTSKFIEKIESTKTSNNIPPRVSVYDSGS